MTEVLSRARRASRQKRLTEIRARSRVTRWALPAAVAGAMVAGVVIRLARVGEKVLSFDEAYTLATAQRSFVGMLETFRFEANGTLYAVLLWPLLRISESEATIRALAVAAGIATIAAAYWTCKAFADRQAAAIAAALVAISPALIGWSVYGRAYAFAILFAVLSFGCLARAVAEDIEAGARWRWLYVVATLAMAYSSVLAAVTLLPIHVAAVLVRARERRRLRSWLRPSIVFLAGLVPLGSLLVLESRHRDPLAWLWKPDFPLVRRVGGELAAGPTYFADAGGGLAGAILATVVAIFVAGLVLSWRRARTLSWGTGVLVGWTLFPPVLLFVASQVRPMFWGRYLGVVIPALALLVAVVLVRMPKALGTVYGTALAAVLLATSLTASPPFNDFRAKASWVESQREPGDPLVLYPVEQLPPLAYYGRSLQVDELLPVAEWEDTALPVGVAGYRRDYDWGDIPIGPPTDEELTRLSARTGALLVLTYPNLIGEIDIAWAGRRGCEVSFRRFTELSGIAVRCGSRRADR